MTEAWQKRGWQRQQLLEGLINEARKVADEQESPFLQNQPIQFYQDVAIFLLIDLGGKQKKVDYSSEDIFIRSRVLGAQSWASQAKARIVNFSQTENEAKMLMAELARQLLKVGLQPIYSAASWEELEQPEKVLGAAAMDEVPLED